MNSTSAWPVAWNSAFPLWSDWVRHSGWHPVLTAMAFASAGIACAAVWRSCRGDDALQLPWLAAAVLLPILALNTLMALDLLAVLMLRSMAQQQGWYAGRREIQALTLLIIAGAAVLAYLRLRHAAARRPPSQHWLLLGLGLLLTASVLRAVSLHATDQFIGARIAGWSLGRLIDVAGLGGVGTGIVLALRTGHS
jgi:hypothetical protein